MRTRHRIVVGKDRHRFSCAHMTVFPDGTKERLHGHNFQVTAALDLHDVSFARFLDFARVKSALDRLCEAWDERLLIAERSPFLEIVRRDAEEIELRLCGRRYVLPADEVALLPVENVVVEALAEELAMRLVAELGGALKPEVVAGIDVSVSESPGQGASFYWTWPEG